MTKDAKGKFCRGDGESFGTYVDEKGYPRMSAGPHRGVRVHTLVAEAMLGRKLEPHEDVNHKNQNKLDPAWTNLEVLDHRKHGWVSSQQAQFMRRREAAAKAEWEAEFGLDSTIPAEPTPFSSFY
jgi:hypothetical protein